MGDIGNMSYGLRANAKDLYDLWLFKPWRREEFGERELLDIRETVIGLQVLLREIDKAKQPKLVASEFRR
jgi:hypothetical protein